jgi:hypothetical protein
MQVHIQPLSEMLKFFTKTALEGPLQEKKWRPRIKAGPPKGKG